jgi:prepilin-type N-terminal cleavage/methylation domain-containing protein
MKNKSINNRAFTLIELLVVIAIIALLSSLVLNALASARMKANDTKISQDLRQFRIAAELYYNDNREYPTTAMDDQNKSFAINQPSTNWSNKLSFFIKKAEAAGHSITALCVNFDKAAEKMVAKKYLSSIPVHPYDNDAAGVCYKAVNATTTFVSYGVLTTQISVNDKPVNKRTGFIIGDTSSSGLDAIEALTPEDESAYPADESGAVPDDLLTSIDDIEGITDGDSGDSTGSEGIINPGPVEDTALLCSNGIDDDADGAIDVYDSDCTCGQDGVRDENFVCQTVGSCPDGSVLQGGDYSCYSPEGGYFCAFGAVRSGSIIIDGKIVGARCLMAI